MIFSDLLQLTTEYPIITIIDELFGHRLSLYALYAPLHVVSYNCKCVLRVLIASPDLFVFTALAFHVDRSSAFKS